jgi:hypothetical protein
MIGARMGVSVSDLSTPRRVSSGETIRIGMDFQDESSIEGAYALFVNAEDRTHTIALRGNRKGDASATITMEGEVARNAAPGEYRCQYVQVHDAFDNYAVLHPELHIRFWVGQR